MEKLFMGYALGNGILFLLFIAYFPVVWLNFVFTFDQLPIANVPFYYTCTVNEVVCFFVDIFFSPKRYYFAWWVFAFDIFLIGLIVLPFYNLLLAVLNNKKRMNLFFSCTLPIGLISLFQILKFVYIVIGWVFCEANNLCRNYDCGQPDVNCNAANWLYIYAFSFSLAFLIYSVVYTFTSRFINNSLTPEKDE